MGILLVGVLVVWQTAFSKEPVPKAEIFSWRDLYVFSQPVLIYVPTLIQESVGNGECVAFIQANGYEEYRGNAYEWVKYVNPDIKIGWPGYVVLLDEGPYQHLALITGTDGGYNLVEQNYLGIGIVSSRTIPYDYIKIVGFVKHE